MEGIRRIETDYLRSRDRISAEPNRQKSRQEADPCIREKGYKTGKSTEYFQICRCVYIADYIGRIDICFMQPTDTGIIC